MMKINLNKKKIHRIYLSRNLINLTFRKENLNFMILNKNNIVDSMKAKLAGFRSIHLNNGLGKSSLIQATIV
jgi:hypothetical protein